MAAAWRLGRLTGHIGGEQDRFRGFGINNLDRGGLAGNQLPNLIQSSASYPFGGYGSQDRLVDLVQIFRRAADCRTQFPLACVP